MKKVSLFFTLFLSAILIFSTSFSQIQTGTSTHSGKFFTCTKDCPPAEPGYQLIDCMILSNHMVEHAEGRPVPLGRHGNGYVSIQSKTEYQNGSVVHDEILSCGYWKLGVTLPPSYEEMEEEAEKNMGEESSDIVSEYNSQVGNMPTMIGGYLGNENLHIYYTDDDFEIDEYAAVTEDGLIVRFGTWIDEDVDGQYDLWREEGRKTTVYGIFKT